MENENDTNKVQLNWWGRLLQNQGATILAIMFTCGGLYAKIGTMEENLEEVKEELKIVRELDKSQDALKVRLKHLEEWKKDMEEWRREKSK